jgi:hypothetical protein
MYRSAAILFTGTLIGEAIYLLSPIPLLVIGGVWAISYLTNRRKP